MKLKPIKMVSKMSKLRSFGSLCISLCFLVPSIAHSDTADSENFEVKIRPSEFEELLPRKREYFTEYNFAKPDELPVRPCAIFRGQEITCKTFGPEEDGLGIGSLLLRRPALVVGGKLPAPLPSVHPHLGLLFETHFPEGSHLADELTLTRVENIDGSEFGWAAVSSVIDGVGVVERWTEMAASGQTYSCTLDTCSIVVPASFYVDDGTYRGLAACVTYKFNSTYSSPTKCNPILIHLEAETLLLAVETFFDHMYSMGGEVDFSIVFNSFSGEELREDLVALVVGALKSESLGLDVYTQVGQIIGSKKYTYLDQIDRWTMQTVRFSRSGVLFDGGDLLSKYEIATTLYVSAQNSSSSRDWRLPSEPVASSYIDLLKNQFYESFEDGCNQFDWKPNGMTIRITCE